MQKTSMANNLSSLSYTHGDIFETFAFPEGTLTGQLETLERVGEKFFQLRQEYMESHKQGLTRFYNDFHNPEKTNDALQHLRCAQGAVNRAVAEAYGWNDLDLSCDFQQVAYLPTGSNMRFTILERTRLDVLNRLSQLNASRHAVQCLATQDDDKIEDVAPFELKMVDDSAPSARGKRRRG
jgi:hypothetical protein